MMGAEDIEKAILSGTPIQSQADLNEFITKASAEKKAAVGKELGIEDWNTLTVQEFANKASAYRESGKAEAYVRKTENIKKMREIESTKARNIPRAIALADGDVKHYADADSNFAIARSGDAFTVYDYTTGNVTRELTRAEVNAELARYRERKSASTVQERATSETANATSENLSSDNDSNKNNNVFDSFTNEKLRNNAKIVTQMDSVADLTGKEFSSQEPGTLKEKVLAFFASFGNKVKTKEIGTVAVTQSSFRDDKAHGLTRNKVIAFKAVREVLTDGRVIDTYSPDGKPYDRITIAAPIRIAGEKYYMGVMVQKDNQSNRMYLHDVITEKATLSFNTEPTTENGEGIRDKGHLYITSILQNALKVNTLDEKNTKKAFESELSEEKAAPTVKQIKEAAEARRQDAEIEALAKEKIKDYEDLSKPNQSMIRKVLRDARAKGLSDADALSYARVAARSGLDITFDKKACYNKEKGTYAAGFYDPENNRIVVNPETKKKHTVLLIHELSHAMRSYRKNSEVKYFIDEDAKVSEKMWKAIRKYYADENGKVDEALALDEASAYYAEAIFGTQGAIDLLLGEKPTLKQKILSFFTKSAEYYSTDEKLSKEARRHFRKFKAMFDAFTARNYGRNAETGLAGDKKDGRRYSYEGKASDGKSIYKSNFPKGTPKKAKSERILKYITNVWSKEPISLVISNGETSRTIKAKFDPTIDETQNTPTDASKIAGGNRHGNGTEKRVTLDLADDYYQIVQESKYNYSKEETGKDNPAHEGVKLWHYFVDDIYFIEQETSGLFPYRVTINVKEKDNGDFVYSFNAEKVEESSTQQTVHAAVNTRKGANGELFIDSIPDFSEKSNPSDENSSEKSSESGKRSSMDSDYMAAVNSGDMVTAQRMVDEAAKAKMPNSKITNSDGSLRKVYHGTNTGEFTVFNPDYIGMSSGDGGFFGKGFYFAYSESEAKYYGKKRVVSAYLNIENPFNFQTQMQTFDGKRAVSGRAPDAVAFLNFAEKFPKLAENAFVTVFEGDQGRDISLIAFAKAFRDVLENKIFEYQTVKNEFGEKETIALADKREYTYEYNGKTETYYDYDFQQRFYGEANEIDVAYEYLSNVVYKYIDMYSRTRLILDKNDEFTQALKNMGYDGTIQSVEGDEAVAFYPEQIKSADPVTYDDDGKVIPLSERFNPKKSDIRFSMEEIDPAKMGEPKLPRTAGTMSTGQYKKRTADLTKAKSYSKDQIYDIVKKLPMADMAMEKTREQVAEAIWQIYNEQLTANERREAAHDIAQFLTARLLTEAKTENPDAAEANEAMAYLRTGIGLLAFSEADRAELLHNLDKDGLRRILGRWGFKGKRNADGTLQGVRTPMEVFVTDIAREMPGMDYINMSQYICRKTNKKH